jgi:hypothetical protein
VVSPIAMTAVSSANVQYTSLWDIILGQLQF